MLTGNNVAPLAVFYNPYRPVAFSQGRGGGGCGVGWRGGDSVGIISSRNMKLRQQLPEPGTTGQRPFGRKYANTFDLFI